MISSLRNKKGLITFSLWFIIAAFVGTIFFVWGVGDKAQQQLYAAKVDDAVITDQDFRNKVESTREQFRQLFGNNADQLFVDSNLEKTVMQTLISEALLRNEAARLNIPVSDAEVAANIQSIEAFQTDGQFDQNKYVQLLARSRLTPQIFEDSFRNDILLQKMEELIKNSVAVSDIEMQKEYTYRNTEATIRFLEISADNYVTKVSMDDEAVKAFYEENQENYRVPEKADVKYVTFDKDSFNKEFSTDDKEIEQFFIQNKESFTQPEQVRAAHILFAFDNWGDEMAANEVYKKAKSVLKEIKNGADFGEMAKKYSDDGNAEMGGELGFFTRGQMVPEFEEAAFNTKPGEVSDVVKTQFGFHIIKVEEYEPEKNPTLDEVKDQIKEMIIEQKGNNAFRTYVFETYKDILNKSNITAYNQDAEDKLETNEIKGLTAAGNKEPLTGLQDVASKLMKLNKTELSQVIDVRGTQMVFEITEKYDSYIPELKDVKEKVLADFISTKSLELAKKQAEEAAELGSMDEAAEKLKKTYTTTPKFKRNEPISGLGMNAALMEDIFNSEPEQFIQNAYTVGSKVYLVQVKDIIKPDYAEIDDQEKEDIKSALYGTKTSQAVTDYVESLKAKAEIIISPRYKDFYN